MDKYILGANQQPVLCEDIRVWGEWFERDPAVRRVALTELDGVEVSTVFLGINHNWGEGVPILWETMIFGGAEDQSQWRYTSHAEALAGHAAAVALAQQSLVPSTPVAEPLPQGLPDRGKRAITLDDD